jgi:hypothetical protein
MGVGGVGEGAARAAQRTGFPKEAEVAAFEIRDWLEFTLDCVQTVLLVLIAARVYRYGRGPSASRRLMGRDDGRTGGPTPPCQIS